MTRSKFWAALAAALTMALTASLAGPTDARADRCNPDEMAAGVYKLITGEEYEPVFGEDQGPFCEVMKTVVYPAIGCDPVHQSLNDCVQSQPARLLTILDAEIKRVVTSIVGCNDPKGCGPPPCGPNCEL
jgi:hypothetical protein